MTRPDRLRWVRRHRFVPVGPRQAVRILDGLEARQRRSTSFVAT